jgi:hypothetical protein
MPPTEVILAQLNRKMDVLNKRVNELKKMRLQHRLEMKKLKDIDKKVTELDTKIDTYHNDEMQQLDKIVRSSDMTYVTCEGSPTLYTDDNEVDWYKWTSFSSLLTGLGQPGGTMNINFTYIENGVEINYKTKNNVTVSNVVDVNNGTLDHVKLQVGWYPPDQACNFGFKVEINQESDDFPEPITYHFASTVTETSTPP